MNQLVEDSILTIVSDKIICNIDSICASTSLTAVNTALCMFDYTTLFVAVLALLTSFAAMIYAKKTYKSQKQTEENTLKTQGNTQRISLDTQRGLLIDLVRHLYRNLVVTYAIKTKLNHFGYDKCYPSEEHLLKLKVPVENIHPEAFYDNKHYKEIDKLYLLLRNYNTEIDVALNHFLLQGMARDVKERDLDTLLLKPGILVENIVNCLCKLYSEGESPKSKKDDIYHEAYETICNAAQTNQNGVHGEAWLYDFMPYEDENSRFITKLFVHTSGSNAAEEFLRMFNADALIECGNNDKESPKIYMIKYTNNR